VEGSRHKDRKRASHALCSGPPCDITAREKSKNGKQEIGEREDNTLCEENEIWKEAKGNE